jgi:hypothetical protein
MCQCTCSCGTQRLVDRYSLLHGASQSCGCLRTEQLVGRLTTHGMAKLPEYRVWHAMLDRCGNPQAQGWLEYGARGVRVCRRWRKFENFIADMGLRPVGQRYTLERLNNEKGYSPANCCWATYQEQARNKRNTTRLGKVSLVAAAEFAGVSASAARSRRTRGSPDSEVLTAEGSKGLRRAKAKRLGTGLLVTLDGQTVTLKELSEASGVPYNTLKYRLKQGLELL